MTMKREEAIRTFERSPKPPATMKDWERGQTVSAGIQLITCQHEGWTFASQGRCCFKCGAYMADFGD